VLPKALGVLFVEKRLDWPPPNKEFDMAQGFDKWFDKKRAK
jgi:hypothetical protein